MKKRVPGRQPYLPVVDETLFKGLALGELKKQAKAHYLQHFAGRTVVNQDKGIRVTFSKPGLRHSLHARNAGYLKVKALFILDELMEVASFSNFKGPDADDSNLVFGYFNFEAKCQIEGNQQRIRLVVRLTRDGKFFYDHALRVRP